ncbi:hypothetical protein [Anaplasma capra]|uniref:hypothetical protein n=1 Tax=Anaplasma capra TaxID=1562740 RepID=UPI0021D5BBEE|nr:hypothetical protein [Anaplasma capra]MCU7611151.1 hypothetical protein [Anaplasma capra]MCU7612345.1 hypothetical protein [Anaplasma capra]
MTDYTNLWEVLPTHDHHADHSPFPDVDCGFSQFLEADQASIALLIEGYEKMQEARLLRNTLA